MDQIPPNQPFINAHTHIFRHKHVPPLIGKTLVPFPVYHILTTPFIIRLVDFLYFKKKNTFWFETLNSIREWKFWFNRHTQHNGLFRAVVSVVGLAINTINFVFVAALLLHLLPIKPTVKPIVWVVDLIKTIPVEVQILIVLLLTLFVESVRRTTWKLVKFVFGNFLKELTGPKTLELAKRYVALAYYADQLTQDNVFARLNELYPEGTRFVILPMDMEYMDAGKPAESYMMQIAELKEMLHRTNSFFRDHAFVFVAVDPRRITDADPDRQLNHEAITRLIDEDGFYGIKLYPPLGYYPFDKNLLQTLLWACQNQIPVVTHCIKGVIYYRGPKQKGWDFHPIFKYTEGGEPIALPSYKNSEFCYNFTHPLNYECLLDPVLLGRVLRYYDDPALNKLFGFESGSLVPTNDLRNLKICLAHFGGEDEWERFLDRDWGNFEMALHKPLHPYDVKGQEKQFWGSVSWFSIVYNMLLKYPNVYSDLSFILYDERIMNLLKQILLTTEIADKIMFGTDFFVVRQKKTEKTLWTDLKAVLGEDMFHKIAFTNPERFLSRLSISPAIK